MPNKAPQAVVPNHKRCLDFRPELVGKRHVPIFEISQVLLVVAVDGVAVDVAVDVAVNHVLMIPHRPHVGKLRSVAV